MASDNLFETSYSSDRDALYSVRMKIDELRALPTSPLSNVTFTPIPVGRRSVRNLRRTRVKISLTAEELDAAGVQYRWLSGGRLVVDHLPPELFRCNRAALELVRGRRLSTGHVVALEEGPSHRMELGIRVAAPDGQMLFRMSLDPSRGLARFRCLCGSQNWETGDGVEACLHCGTPGPDRFSSPHDGPWLLWEDWIPLDPLARAVVLPEIDSYLADCLLWDEHNEGRRDLEAVQPFLAGSPTQAFGKSTGVAP